MNLTFELGVMARGLAGNADEADDHSEVKLLRAAIARIEALEAGLNGIAKLAGLTLLGGTGMDSERAYQYGAHAAFGQAAEIARSTVDGDVKS